ncbi:MAG: glycosyltransferase family 2 protein [bacterium]|nr:glycosyltransferase family 2 protein [bacterium]
MGEIRFRYSVEDKDDNQQPTTNNQQPVTSNPVPPPHIALIILNWNGLKDTLECLESVFKNDYKNYSIYLIDNASQKDELKSIKEFCIKKLSTPPVQTHSYASLSHPKPSTIFIQNTENLGFAEGNNVGIRKALESGADYIFTLNNDTVVDQHFLSTALETAKKTGAGIVATKMVNYYDRSKLDNTGHDLLTSGDTVPRGRNESSTTYHPQPTPFGSCAGAALYSSKMLKQIGLFDKDFFLNYEDSDLSLRAIVQGWTCVYSPDSIVYHKLNASIGKIKDSKYRVRSQRNQLWAYLHNTPGIVILLNLPWILFRDLLVILISFITLRWTITWIFIRSRLEIIKTMPKILKKHRKVMRNRKVSSWWFWRHQLSWFGTYWQYFKEIVVRGKKGVMEVSPP